MAVLDKIEMEAFKTKAFNDMLKSFETKVFVSAEVKDKKKSIKRSVLVINDKKDDKVTNSGRNLVGVEMINLGNINIVDILRYKNLVITAEAVKKLEAQYK